MDEQQNFRCSMCYFSTGNNTKYMNHIVRQHRHDPNFIVYCNFCPYSTKSWGAFKTHVSRNHKDNQMGANSQLLNEDNFVENEDTDTAMPTTTFLSDQRQAYNAAFTLSLECKDNMTVEGLNDAVSSCKTLVEQHIRIYQNQVRKQLESRGLAYDFLDGIDIDSLLDEFSTKDLRDAYYERHNRYIKPEKVKLYSTRKTVKGFLKTINIYGYYIPLRESLSKLLEMPEIWNCVNRPHFTQNELMQDVCDGDYVKNHHIFKRNQKALQIFLNNDDIELVNPIGSHTKKHKLSMFYYSLGNVPPEHRSNLTAIQLLCVARSNDLKKSDTELLLQDFVTTVNQLSQGGIELIVNGVRHMFEGALVMCPCDTLAAHALGGFKEGVAFAKKPCRVCMGSLNEMKSEFCEEKFKIRDEVEHRNRCERLDDMQTDIRQYWSKMWGINCKSPLQSIADFPVCAGLVQDPMHLLLEGVVPYVLKLVLNHFVNVEKYFKLDWLNQRIISFPYTYLESGSKPEKIDRNHLSEENKLRQTSASLMTLCLILPYIIHSKIPDDNVVWTNFLRLMQITLLATSPVCKRETASRLAQLILDHHRNFLILFPDASVIPKMHYLIHLPSQMLMYGPLRHHWCMRYEAKHGFFKTKKWKNFKNLPYSVATKHQKYISYKMSGPGSQASLNFLYSGDIVKKTVELPYETDYPSIAPEISQLANNSKVYKSNDVCIQGHRYRPGCAVVLKYVNDLPKFGLVKEIVVIQDSKFFIVRVMDIEQFNFKVLAYVLNPTDRLALVCHSDLYSKWPLNLHKVNGKFSVVNKYSYTCEVF